MSKPKDIYKSISRELLENFVWQLQMAGMEYERSVNLAIEAGSEQALAYSFACPSQSAAETVRDSIHAQADDEISIQRQGDAWLLKGQTEPFAFEPPTILRWVAYMCDAGAKFGCRFDGWRCPVADAPGTQSIVGSTGSHSNYPEEIVIELPGDIGPIERGQRFREPIDAALGERGLGETTGGESVLSPDSGRPSVVGARLFVGTHAPDEAMTLLRELLPKVGCPKGTLLKHDDKIISVE